jgi:SAM-dependent methyltransferase
MTPQMRDIETRYRTQFMYDVLKRVSRTRFESIIDFGCGDGSILLSMKEKIGANGAKGIDLGVSEIAYDHVFLCRGDLLEYVPDAQYQLVISNQVFEHIYEPWLPRYFGVLKGSCAPGGLVLLSTPNRWRPTNIARGLLFRRPYMMSPNKGVPPEQHLGHHRECSYRELGALMDQYFEKPEWDSQILRTVPRPIGSIAHWIFNLLVYFVLWPVWRPLLVSASHDHYVVIQRKGHNSMSQCIRKSCL